MNANERGMGESRERREARGFPIEGSALLPAPGSVTARWEAGADGRPVQKWETLAPAVAQAVADVVATAEFVVEPVEQLFRRREIKRLEFYRFLVTSGTFNEGFEAVCGGS